MEKSFPLASTVFTALALGLLGGVFIASADAPATFTSIADRYHAPSLPNRDDLVGQLPELPSTPPLDPSVARQQGARALQGLNPDQSFNPDTMMSQINNISAEDANPNRLSGFIPPSASAIANRVSQVQSTTGNPVSNLPTGNQNSSLDPLGTNPNIAAQQQSNVTRDGSLPNGSLNVTGGNPTALARTLINAAGTDVENSYNNALAANLALKLQIVNRQAERLAGKLDALNTSAADLNNTSSDFVIVFNDILKKLPTLPRL